MEQKGAQDTDWCKGNICSVEVKNYTISTNSNGLINNISKQAIERQQHLPNGMKQEVIIDIRGQKVSAKEQAAIRKSIADKSNGIISISSIRFKTE